MGRRSNKTGAAARLGTINRGVGHNIKKHSAMPIKRKRPVQKTKKKVGARDAALFSVKFSASNCQTSGNTESCGDRRFFRSRAAGRRPTVSLNSAARSTPSAVEVNNNKSVIVVAGGGGGGDCGKLSRDFTKTNQTQQEHTLRRSPRKSMTQQQQQQQESSPQQQQQQQLLRRSPRKSAGGRLSGVHMAMGRPTRLLLPSQSPRKSASLSTGAGGSVTSTSSVCVSPHTTQPPVRRTSPRKQPSNLQRLDTCTSSSEQLLMMEVEEDKENESPDHSSSSSSVIKQHKLKNPKFYSIFYREQRRDGLDDVMMGTSETPSTSGTSSPSSAAVKATSKRRAGNSSSSCARQLVIDAGQKKFGAVTCDTCGLVYCAGDEHDAALHAQHHAGLHNELQFPGWKRERVVAEFMDGRVLMVSGGDPQYAWRKAAAVLRVVDSELGFWGHSNGGGGGGDSGSQIGDTLLQDRRTKVFLYVGERQVRGCLVVEPVDEAYRVTCSQSTSPEQHRGDEGGTQVAPNNSSIQPPTCSDDVCACVCGVSRVWTHYQHRRRGIASRLLNAVRCNFMMVPLTWNDVAFSDPTPAGFQFATAITGTASFLVYRH